jgi:hypothetical protein
MNEKMEMSQEFADLVFFALDHGINSIREGALAPFIVYVQNGKRSLHRYAADTFEASLVEARKAASHLPPTVSACVIAYDGNVTVNGVKSDAIIVEGAEKGNPIGMKLAQRYNPKRFLKALKTVGNVSSISECKSILSN